MLDEDQLQQRTRQALDYTRALIDQYGGRLAGSNACQKVAERLCSDLAQVCGAAQARIEPFITRPSAFTRFYQVDILLYVVGLALLWLNLPLVAAVLLNMMMLAAGLQFGYYVELYDRLYSPKTCYNVIACLEPRHPARQQVILSAHHDSAQELRFLKDSQKLYALKIILPDFFRVLAGVFAVYWIGYRALWHSGPPERVWMLVLLSTIGAYFVFTKFSIVSREAVPGAGDNLIASAMLLELARCFADLQTSGRSRLEDTRLIFASFDAEEAGLRGSRAYVRAHRAELAALPTRNLNIDSIYTAADLQLMLSDLNDHVKLDRGLAEECVQIARSGGYAAAFGKMRFGGGGTDAAEFAMAGVRATTMLAMPTGIVRDGLVYHTMRDTIEAVQPEAVAACLFVAARWVQNQDFAKDQVQS